MAAGACSLAYLPLTDSRESWTRSLLKTASVLLLALAAWSTGAPVALVLALAICAAGDFFLSRDGDTSFMTGVASFAAGHVVYTVLFLTRPGSDIANAFTFPQLFLVAALILLGATAGARILPAAGELRLPVMIYIPIILAMGLAALALPEGPTARLAIISAFAFAISDFVLAVEKFLLSDGHPARRVTPYVIWPLYWGAQAGFLAAFA